VALCLKFQHEQPHATISYSRQVKHFNMQLPKLIENYLFEKASGEIYQHYQLLWFFYLFCKPTQFKYTTKHLNMRLARKVIFQYISIQGENIKMYFTGCGISVPTEIMFSILKSKWKVNDFWHLKKKKKGGDDCCYFCHVFWMYIFCGWFTVCVVDTV